MKKIALAVVLLTAISITYAQEGNNICVWNALNTYTEGGSSSDLERAVKCTDDAITNEATMNKAKTWWYRAKFYRTIFQDSVLKKKYGTAAFESIKAFKKLQEINDPKFKEWDEAYTNLVVLGTLTFNEGVDQYQKRNYAQAYQYFYGIKDINAVITARGKATTIDLGAALKNAAISAENSGDTAGALKVYKDWLEVAPSGTGYQRYAQALKKSGDTIEARKQIDLGLGKYPNDAGLLVEKINIFLGEGKYSDAMSYVDNLLKVEPKNEGALFIKGMTYDKIGGKGDSVLYYYNKVLEVNPKNYNAIFNIAAYYYNKGRDIYVESQKLGTKSADLEKLEEMNLQIQAYYKQAQPKLELAQSMHPDDMTVNRSLKQIESFLVSYELSKAKQKAKEMK